MSEEDAAILEPRSVIVKKAAPIKIEAIVRGYAGSGWAEYQREKSVCGIALPDGLRSLANYQRRFYLPRRLMLETMTKHLFRGCLRHRGCRHCPTRQKAHLRSTPNVRFCSDQRIDSGGYKDGIRCSFDGKNHLIDEL